MPRSTNECVVSAPPGDVYAHLTDPAELARTTLPASRVVADRSLPDGTREIDMAAPLPGGKSFDSTTVFLERIPDERVVTRATRRSSAGVFSLGFTGENTTTLQPHPQGTQVVSKVDWRFNLPPLNLFAGKRVAAGAELLVLALQAHFELRNEAESGAEPEFESEYEWEQADQRAIERLAFRHSRRVRTQLLVLFPSILLGFLVQVIFLLIAFIVAGSLIANTVQILMRWSPLQADLKVTLRIQTAGLEIFRGEGESGELTKIAWADLTAIRLVADYVLLTSSTGNSTVVPRRALDSIPNGLGRVRLLASRASAAALEPSA